MTLVFLSTLRFSLKSNDMLGNIKMKRALIIFFVLLSVSSKGQDYELPKMNHYHMGRYYWSDTSNSSQMEYWHNGNLKVEYSVINHGKKLKKEYFENGRIKLTVEIKQVFTVDTIWVIDPVRFEESVEVYRGYTDIADGKYIEYHNWPDEIEDRPMTFGYYKNGEKYGKWQSTNGPLNDIVIATYDAHGQLNGEYIEYYNLRYGKMERIKWQGQYGVVSVSRLGYDYETKGYRQYTYNQSRKVGKWLLLDIDGKVLETVIYNWNN